jgi:hypothetical protein
MCSRAARLAPDQGELFVAVDLLGLVNFVKI